MRYRVRHTSRYDYGSAVDLGSHMLHLTPRSLPGQRVLDCRITADPAASGQREAADHFGNTVTWLFLDSPHERFEVTAEATVEVRFPPPPAPADTIAWEAVAAAARAGPGAWQAAEFLFESPLIQDGGGAAAATAAWAAPSFVPGRPVLAALLDLNGRIRREFAFRPGATTLSTPVLQVLRQRAGVCQDFSHLMISALRALGLPARYVSGYVRTRPTQDHAAPALGEPGAGGPTGNQAMDYRGTDHSHAWVGCWLGPAHGWVDLDPTNGLVVREDHIVLGWGRDYGDVSPIRGIVLGGGAHDLGIAVDVQPLAAWATAAWS